MSETLMYNLSTSSLGSGAGGGGRVRGSHLSSCLRRFSSRHPSTHLNASTPLINTILDFHRPVRAQPSGVLQGCVIYIKPLPSTPPSVSCGTGSFITGGCPGELQLTLGRRLAACRTARAPNECTCRLSTQQADVAGTAFLEAASCFHTCSKADCVQVAVPLAVFSEHQTGLRDSLQQPQDCKLSSTRLDVSHSSKFLTGLIRTDSFVHEIMLCITTYITSRPLPVILVCAPAHLPLSVSNSEPRTSERLVFDLNR